MYEDTEEIMDGCLLGICTVQYGGYWLTSQRSLLSLSSGI
jgi:hypothetical protein